MEEKTEVISDNKKRNVVAYVFSGLTVLGVAAAVWTFTIALGLSGPSESAGEALGKVFGIIIMWLIAGVILLGSYGLGITACILLATCIKKTANSRKYVNITFLSILVGAMVLGAILILIACIKA